MIILAFPGMGKTPLARKFGKFVDLDFGLFREALGVSKVDEEKLLKPFARLAKAYVDNRFVVLTNEPKLMRYLHVDVMYLPKNPSFSAKKLKVTEETVVDWIAGWDSLAKQNKVRVTYLKCGLDHYLGRGNE